MHSSPRPRLRTRLIAWYAGSLCIVLLAAAASTRYVVRRTLDRAHAESVVSSIELFRQFFRVEIAEYRSVDATLTHIASELVFEDRVIDVHRPDGTLFIAPGVQQTSPQVSLRSPVRDVSAPLDPTLAPGWTIDVHASTATLDAAARRVDYWLLGGIPFVVCIAAVLGWWLAGRALRPIGQMAAEAGTLDVRAGSRLSLQDPDDELGRFGASFNAVLDRLDLALSQQRRFLTDAAHELRTPIARLRSRTELGRMSLAQTSSDEARGVADETLGALERELRATSDVVGGLLSLARAESGANVLTLAKGFVDDVVSEELPRWQESAAAAGLTIVLGEFEDVAAVFDASLIRRLVALLLDNAVNYGAAGDTITVHCTARGDQVRLVVEDEGIGIPSAERTAVFARFHRAVVARERRADGSGLGLSLAQWIVEQHAGTIEARDRADARPGAAIVASWPTAIAASELSRAARA
jgi:signal transduction histidine kinase